MAACLTFAVEKMPMSLPLMHGARANVTEAIGGTPIVRLNKVAAHVKSSIYVKCEAVR
jgi:threonine dehydratase